MNESQSGLISAAVFLTETHLGLHVWNVYSVSSLIEYVHIPLLLWCAVCMWPIETFQTHPRKSQTLN